MKTAACIALLALAASACSKSDTTRTPDDMTTSPGTETATGPRMPVETAAPSEIAQPSSVAAAGAAGTSGNGVTDGSANVFQESGRAPTDDAMPSPGRAAANGAAPARPDADNTRVNQRDRGPSATPMDQGNTESDLKITQKIRQAVMGDGGLSFTAKNVKIITNKGTVVLRGPVQSDDERARIDAAAKTVAGDSNVINEIEIKK